MVRSCLVALALLSACDRATPAKTSPATTASVAAPTPPPPANTKCNLAEIPLRRPQPERLVAIGDIHGDLAAARAALRTAGAIDTSDKWIGGKLVLVQTGDILDRGGDEQAIMDLFEQLEPQAKAAGGEVIALIGNHELMNAAGDFRYVTPIGMHDFDNAPGADPSKWPSVPEEARGRFAALAPGGPYAKWSATHDVVAIVGDTLFSHAGVTAEFVTQIDEINRSSRCWLDGLEGGPQQAPLAMTSEESPVWTRVYGGDSADCAALGKVLADLKIKRMVVGHTVQKAGVNALCDGALWRIDVGLAALYDGPIQVLQMFPEAKVLSGTRL
ncbi:MAG TPA: metallophosphoesterase [Kofleriaceae bacterium]